MSGQRRFRSKNPSREDEVANPLDLSRLLANDEQKERFQKSFLGRKIISPKYVSILAFHDFNFPNLLVAQNVDRFVNATGIYYPDLVRVFYCNLERRGNGFRSWVKGVSVRMNFDQVGECLEVPTSGEKIRTDFHCDWEDYDRKAFYLSMCRLSEDEISQKRQRVGASSSRNVLSVGPLNVEDRLLHYILCYVLVPKASNYAQISDFELQVLYAIKTNKPINWSHLIVTHIISQKDRSSGLPYALAISRFLEYCGVDVTNEIAVPMTREDNQINLDIFGKMGIAWDDAFGSYKHRSDIHGEPSNPPPQPEVGQSSQEITNQMIMEELRSLRGYMETCYEDLSTRLRRLEALNDDDDDEDAES